SFKYPCDYYPLPVGLICGDEGERRMGKTGTFMAELGAISPPCARPCSTSSHVTAPEPGLGVGGRGEPSNRWDTCLVSETELLSDRDDLRTEIHLSWTSEE
ncbi:putative transcription factor, partial [Dissostichus eleginoides]